MTQQKLSITVRYFAVLREQRGISSEMIETRAGSCKDLYHDLAKIYKFSLSQDQLGVALNDQFASFEQKLKDGDVVTFIPPVAGG